MTTYKVTFRGRVGQRDEIRAEIYYVNPEMRNGREFVIPPGTAVNRAIRLVKNNVQGIEIGSISVKQVRDLEHTMIRVFRIHKVLEGEVQENGTVSPIAPLTISVENAGVDEASGAVPEVRGRIFDAVQ